MAQTPKEIAETHGLAIRLVRRFALREPTAPSIAAATIAALGPYAARIAKTNASETVNAYLPVSVTDWVAATATSSIATATALPSRAGSVSMP